MMSRETDVVSLDVSLDADIVVSALLLLVMLEYVDIIVSVKDDASTKKHEAPVFLLLLLPVHDVMMATIARIQPTTGFTIVNMFLVRFSC
jgi:hypothetical protein